jgi:XRE family aerobic/anaerobic benzoate catabolism transcriptional regulator
MQEVRIMSEAMVLTLSPEEVTLDHYIEDIGNRVRALRAKRGMTRKDLAKHSDVSERYLAQLETGKANITLAVLWRVADAFDISLSSLIPCPQRDRINPLLSSFVAQLTADQQLTALQIVKRSFNEQLSRGHGIALIGLRGAGKSTLGEALAKEMGVRFIRLTALIEEQANMSVAEILDLGGQKKFRRIEAQALNSVMELGEPVVLETGGSLVSQTETFNMLLENFFSVWIKASPEEHLGRVMQQGDTRPMQGFKEAIEDLRLILEEREAEYQQADYALDTTARDINDCLSELRKLSSPFLQPNSKA